jgi:hypothetical protein
MRRPWKKRDGSISMISFLDLFLSGGRGPFYLLVEYIKSLVSNAVPPSGHYLKREISLQRHGHCWKYMLKCPQAFLYFKRYFGESEF